MLQRCWGVELWDQFDNVTKYNEKQIQFYEKYESFLKDRCAIEDDYACRLKKLTKTFTPKAKEQDEFFSRFSFSNAFLSTLKELNDLASQHELIAENLRERSIKQLQQTIKECRDQRKKFNDEYQKLKRQLEKQNELLIKSLRKYEENFDSSRRAKENFERANEDLDLSRAQLEKSRETMNSKAKLADEARETYLLQVKTFNQHQNIFYEKDLPQLLIDLQQFDQRNSDRLKEIFRDFIRSHSEVLPRIQICLNEMLKKTEEIDSIADENRVIDEFKTGYPIPEDYQPIDLNGNNDQNVYEESPRSNTLKSMRSDASQTLNDGNSRKRTSKNSTIRKIFGNSNQKKSITMLNVNAPYPNLPPAQRIKKFQEQIQNCRNEFDRQQKAKEGLVKMRLVFQKTPQFGDEHDVTQQIATIDGKLDELTAEIRQFESFINDIERVQTNNSSDIDSPLRSRISYGSDQSISQEQTYGSVVEAKRSSPDEQQFATTAELHEEQNVYNHSIASSSNEYHCLPSVASLTIDQTDEQNGSFEDDDLDRKASRKAFALYRFTGQSADGCEYVNAVTIDADECVKILEDDQGDGWTRIEKFDGTNGFVPSSYLRIESLPIYQTNRF